MWALYSTLHQNQHQGTPNTRLPTYIILTHWGRDKMAAFFQTTFSNEFSWMKIYGFPLGFHWSLFLGF